LRARQIRNRATLGGNIATASPIGDSAPVLMSLDATLVLVVGQGGSHGGRGDFFTGYRQTVLGADEVIREIVVPRGGPAAGLTRRVEFVKVSHRVELDISIVAAAFRVDVDAAGVVRAARLAYGGVAEPHEARRCKTEAADCWENGGRMRVWPRFCAGSFRRSTMCAAGRRIDAGWWCRCGRNLCRARRASCTTRR
jgi:xanthine dehydrogenase iron-sulfur cluster and FAD-binding subunit A